MPPQSPLTISDAPATPPLCLSLEPAWEQLTDPDKLRAEIDALAPQERKLLRAIEKVGAEVDTEELLDLEREPMRLRGATGATPSRRGVGFALERRGLLIPVHPNRHVVPSEVSELVGEQRRADREAQRRQIRALVREKDWEPRRARFASNPIPVALASALALRESGVELREGVGTPRSLVTKLATRFGREPECMALIGALCRAVGLWDVSATSTDAPPGSLRLEELGRVLFNTWRRGGAWDEALPDGEVLRVPRESREASAAGVFRNMVLNALSELSDGQWASWEAVAAYVRADPRTPGLRRLLERWAGRAGVAVQEPLEIAERIALSTLPHLGVVDIGDVEEDDTGPCLRLNQRGRAYLEVGEFRRSAESSRFVDNQVLRLGDDARVGEILQLFPFVEIGAVDRHLDLLLTQQALSAALAAGFESSVIQDKLAAIAPLPDPIAHMLNQAATVLGRTEYVQTQGFLWVEDSELRELLRTRRQTAELFVDPSPPSGLLINPGVDIERLARRCRSLGVEVVVDGEVYRTRTVAPPRVTSRSSAELGRKKSPSSKIRKRSRSSATTKRRRSSQSLKRGNG